MIRKKFFITFILLNIHIGLYASNIDSLKKIIKTQQKDNYLIIIDAYKKIINYYSAYYPDSAIFYSQEAIKYTEQKNLINYPNKFYILLADIYALKKDYYSALWYYYKTLENKENLTEKEIANLLLKIAKISIEQQTQYKQTYEFIEQAKEIFKEQKDTINWLKAQLLYIQLLAYNKTFELATNLLDNLKNYLDKITEKNYILYLYFKTQGLIFYKQNKLTEASIKYKRALLFIHNTKNPEYYRIKIKLANIYQEEGAYKAAINFIKELDSLAVINKNNIIHTECLLNIGNLFYKQAKYPKAIQYTQKALKLAKKLNLMNFQQLAYKQLSQIYNAYGKKQLAIHSYQKYIKIRDLIDEKKSKKEFLQLHKYYKILLDLKDKQLKLKEQDLLKLQNQKQRLLLIIVSILLLATLGFLFALAKINYNRKKSEKRLKQLAEASLEGLLIHDGKKIIDLNDRLLQMTGFKREDLINQSIYKIIAPKSHQLVKEKLNMDKTVFYELYINRANGTYFEAEVLSKPFVYRKQKVKVVSIRDVEAIKQAIREVELIKTRLSVIMDTFPDGVVMINSKGQINYVSKAFIEIFEADNENYFINKKFSELLKKDYKKIAEIDIKRILNGQLNDIVEYSAYTLTNDEIVLECKGNVLTDHNGKTIGAFIIVRDVTEIRSAIEALIETEARFRKLFDQAKDAIIIYDQENDKIIDANPAAMQLLGLDYFDILEKSIHDFINTNKKINFLKITYSPQPYQIPIKTAKKEILIAQLTASILQVANNDYFLLIIRDITDFYLQQKELENIAQKLKESNLLKDKMFSIIAHDLRGGIGNIKQLLSFMAQNPNDFQFSEIHSLIKKMSNTAANIYDLLENLLNWARSEQNLIDISPYEVKLYDLITEVIQLYSVQIQEKQIKLEIPPKNSIKVLTDENMLKTVIRNLLSNAIKFTYQGGKITISIKEKNNNVIISVSDTGVGIKKDRLNKLFKKDCFYTTRGTKNEKGTGLGMKLVYDFITRMNGRIWVKSQEGKGTTFFIQLKKA